MKFEKIDTNYISKNFKHKGKIKKALKWNENQVTHFVFTCENFHYSDFRKDTVNYSLKDEDNTIVEEIFLQNAEVFCYHYIKKDNKFQLIWKIYDKSLKCPMDAVAYFIKNSIEITDINKNGIPEIWTMYSVSCKGDISPNNLNLIMYEGDKKYKIQGTSLVDYIKGEKYGGEIIYTDEFNNDKKILNFALKKWNKNIRG